MPELAEVERICRIWKEGEGGRIREVFLRGEKRVFRGSDPTLIPRVLTGRILRSSQTHGKQMMFVFSGAAHLGVHLGMTGELVVRPRNHEPEKHDHLVLYQARRALVFNDPRLFGRIRFSAAGPPDFWSDRGPGVLDPGFNPARLAGFLARRRRSPLKAILLDQDCFPGVGNWMADEILWRAELHPRRAGGSLTPLEVRSVWKETRWVSREALRRIADRDEDPPRSWLFPHRWKDGGTCPRTGTGLVRETIGGRTTCWSPGRQEEPGRPARNRPQAIAERVRSHQRGSSRAAGPSQRSET